MKKTLFRCAAAALCFAAFAAAHAQTFPSKPLRIVVNFPPGGAADQIARPLAAALQEKLGQPVVVENKPGANGHIGVTEVARQPADGHTLLMSSGGAITVNGQLNPAIDPNPMKALEPVAPAAVVSVYLVVKPAIPASTLAEFVAYARHRRGDRILVGDVAHHRQYRVSVGAQCGRGLVQPLGAASHDRDGGPGAGQAVGHPQADAGTAAGHHGDVAGQIERIGV